LSGKLLQALRQMLGRRSQNYSRNEIPNHHCLRRTTGRHYSQVDADSAL